MKNNINSHIFICPACKHILKPKVKKLTFELVCSNTKCKLNNIAFPKINGVHCLIDFEHSLFNISDIYRLNSTKKINRNLIKEITRKIDKLIIGSVSENITTKNCSEFINKILQNESKSKSKSKPKVLVIGGGSIGVGAKELYSSIDIELINSDVYHSDTIDIIFDGHSIPFEDNSFDGVWIQAVLEHVLEPKVVVSEIHRVLKKNGIVYSETPFMQQVHMGAYDFQRYTKSGHRWLFKDFTEIESGPIGGVGLSLVWSIYYYIFALTKFKYFWIIIRIILGWIVRTEIILNNKINNDGACGLYFLGEKSEISVPIKEIINYYK